MAVDKTKLIFYSGNNYLKRSDFFSSLSQTVPAGFTFDTSIVTHGLGYIPFYMYAVDFNNDGILWASDYVVSGYITDPGPAVIRAYIDEQNLYIRSGQNLNLSATGPRTVYYGIYLDFTT